METMVRADVEAHAAEIVQKIKNSSIFIHPTDTIYGLGCDATNSAAVQKLRALKERPTNPFSIWVPSVEWIRKHCKITQNSEHWLEKLPGPYTLIVPLRDKDAVAKDVVMNQKTIGVRYPDHWFGSIVELLGRPIVTTSVNKAGEPFLTELAQLDPDIAREVEFAIDEGAKKGRPSKIIDVEKEEVKER